MPQIRHVFAILISTMGICALVPGTVEAQQGFYVSGKVGVQFAPALKITGSSNDRASVCDELINPLYATVNQTAGYENYNCTGPNRGQGDDWTNAFDRARGILTGVTVGYQFQGRLRVELEHLYHNIDYNQASEVPGATGASGDKLTQEIQTATDRIGKVDAHNLFGNLLFDLTTNTRLRPYVGFGVGVSATKMKYGSVWARNSDPNAILTGTGLPNADEIRRNLAGSVSEARPLLSDTSFSYQVLFGANYWLNESLALGVKGQWVNVGDFESDRFAWDPLRGHPPNLRLDGSEPVSGWLTTNDIRMLGVSLNLRYQF